MTAATDPYQPLNMLKVSGNLPVMPQLLVQLMELCSQEDIDLQAVADLVTKDAALAAKVLQLCNSAFIGARSPFADVTQAVVYLGADTIRNLTISVSVQQVFRRMKSNGLLQLDRFWYHSYESAILGQRIAEATGYTNPSEAYLGCLVHDLGKLLMWMAFPGKYAPLLIKGVRCHGGRLAFLEQEKLHINHCDAGAWLLDQWGLPGQIGEAVRAHHCFVDELTDSPALTRIVSFADLLSHCDDPEQECNEAAAKLFRLAPDKVSELREGIDEQIQDMARHLGIRIPIRTAPAEETKDSRSSEIQQKTAVELSNRARDFSQLHGFLQNLLRARNRDQILTTLEESLLILFNLQPALVLLRTDNNTGLQAVVSKKNKLAAQASSFVFSLEDHQQSLPVQCLSLGQLLHSFMPRPEQDPTQLDSRLTSLLGTDGMVLLPLTADSSHIGVLVIGVSKNEYLGIISQSAPLMLLVEQAGMALYIDSLHKQEQQRKAREQLKGAVMLARKIAHEINNPVATLQNYLSVLENKLKGNAEIREELRILREECQRIGTISRQLEDITLGEQVKPTTTIDLNTLLDETVRLYQVAGQNGQAIRFRFQPNQQPVFVTTDENALKQVLTNLINNAVEAVGQEGTVTIKLTCIERQGENRACISIRDDGSGLDPAVKDNLFEAGITNKKNGHSGLGLAIVANLVQRLGGSIEVVEEEGNTIFSIFLPVTPH